MYRAAGWFKVETGSITKCLLMPAHHHVNAMVSILPLQELKGIVIIFMESLMLLLAITRHIIWYRERYKHFNWRIIFQLLKTASLSLWNIFTKIKNAIYDVCLNIQCMHHTHNHSHLSLSLSACLSLSLSHLWTHIHTFTQIMVTRYLNKTAHICACWFNAYNHHYY